MVKGIIMLALVPHFSSPPGSFMVAHLRPKAFDRAMLDKLMVDDQPIELDSTQYCRHHHHLGIKAFYEYWKKKIADYNEEAWEQGREHNPLMLSLSHDFMEKLEKVDNSISKVDT